MFINASLKFAAKVILFLKSCSPVLLFFFLQDLFKVFKFDDVDAWEEERAENVEVVVVGDEVVGTGGKGAVGKFVVVGVVADKEHVVVDGHTEYVGGIQEFFDQSTRCHRRITTG
jgi:hypothetical protein